MGPVLRKLLDKFFYPQISTISLGMQFISLRSRPLEAMQASNFSLV